MATGGANDDDLNTSPLAFTVQLDDPKPRKLNIHDKLSSFALKHRRNPSLPDFKATTAKSLEEPKPSQKFGKHLATPKAGYHSEGYFSSDQDEESIKLRCRNSMPRTMISPVTEDKGFVPEVNGTKPNQAMKTTRRSSMNDLDVKQMMKPKLNKTFSVEDNEDDCDKSDTVSEAGTYTIDKDESPKKEKKKDSPIEEVNEDVGCRKLTPENQQWINEWVKKVAEESALHPGKGGSSGSSSNSASKIPSPINTMPKIREPIVTRRDRSHQPRTNGVHQHRRSSSLSAKDYAEHRKSDSSMETESYLMATESVVTAMQSRMRQNLKLNLATSQKSAGERLHPPSTASDTDTNSDNDAKIFKKPLNAPFSSARLNRAFSLRRARADIEAEQLERKRNSPSPVALLEKKKTPVNRASPIATVKQKTQPTSTPFARTDVGRFSMRSTVSAPKTLSVASPVPKKEPKKPAPGGRSNSSLSSREMEFQNWKRRKSFDPMKAAAEGRKKEMAKKAAGVMTSPSAQSLAMTQSVNLGTTLQTRSGPVLRSASFHTSPLMADGDADVDIIDDEDDESVEEPASPRSSCFSNQPALPPNSPNKKAVARLSGISGSRGSLASEVHSSPSRRARAEFIDNLLVSAISELSIGLKIKSSDLLKKLEGYCEGDERIVRMREDLTACDSHRGSTNSSPAHRMASRDFPAILKNLKSLENVLQLVDDVLFGEADPDD